MADDVAKFKKEASGLARDWTVREALMCALSQADDFNRVVIVLCDVKDDDAMVSKTIQCTQNGLEHLGMLEISKGHT